MSENGCKKICPIQTLLGFISKKWVLFIIKTIAEGSHSYSDMEKKLSNINPSILSSRLKELQDIGFIEKKIISDTPVKIEYHLTKKGKSFSEQFDNIIKWSEKWM